MQAPTDPYETSDANFFLEEVTATSSSANHALQTLLQLPVEDLLCHIDLPPDREPVVFDVDPSKYPMQPWTRAVMTLKTAKTPEQAAQAKKQLSQWFNFGLTPETFVEYAAQQREVRKALIAARDGRGGAK
jgi:hypothetical protein